MWNKEWTDCGRAACLSPGLYLEIGSVGKFWGGRAVTAGRYVSDCQVPICH